MKVCVLNCSPKNNYSITLQSVLFIQKWFQEKLNEDEFDIVPAFSGKVTDKIEESIKNSDLVIMSGAIFHFDIHSSMGELLDDLSDNHYDLIKDKPLTFISTSGMIGDTLAHNRFELWANRNKLKFINSITLESLEVLSPKGREELFCWYKFVRTLADYYKNKAVPKAKTHGKVVLFNTCDSENAEIEAALCAAKQRFENSGFETETITLREKNVKHCTACQCCFSNRVCILDDDWEKTFEKLYLNTDILVYFGKLHYGNLGNAYKTFLERHACLGRSGIEDEVIKSYFFILDEKSDREDISAFKVNCETFDGLNCSFLCDVCEIGNEEKMQELYDKMTIAYNSDIMPQNGFFKNATRTGFADVAARVRFRCPGDFSYFSNLGCYKVPDPIPMAQWLDTAEDANRDKAAMLTPLKMTLEHLDELPVITVRRKNKGVSVIERQKALARGTDAPVTDGVEVHMPPFMNRPGMGAPVHEGVPHGFCQV